MTLTIGLPHRHLGQFILCNNKKHRLPLAISSWLV